MTLNFWVSLLPPECSGYRCVPPRSVDVVLGTEPRVLCGLGKHYQPSYVSSSGFVFKPSTRYHEMPHSAQHSFREAGRHFAAQSALEHRVKGTLGNTCVMASTESFLLPFASLLIVLWAWTWLTCHLIWGGGGGITSPFWVLSLIHKRGHTRYAPCCSVTGCHYTLLEEI